MEDNKNPFKEEELEKTQAVEEVTEEASEAEAQEETQEQVQDDFEAKYEDLKSYILAYGVRARVSATSDSFRYKKELLVKMTIQGKTLKVFFAVDPRFFEGTTIPVTDVSHKKSYASVPSLLKVKSGLSLKRAKAIVDQVMQTKNLVQGDVVPGEHIKELKKLKKAKAK